MYDVIKAKIITGGRTIEKIAEEYRDDDGLDEKDYVHMKNAYEHFDGAIAIFRVWSDDKDNYMLAGWDKEYDEKIMMAMYFAEHTNPFGGHYDDNKELFIADWKSGEYEPTGAFGLKSSDVEVLEVLQRGVNR